MLVDAAFGVTGWDAPLQLGLGEEWQRPVVLAVIGLVSSATAFMVQALLSNRVRIDKLGTDVRAELDRCR